MIELRNESPSGRYHIRGYKAHNEHNEVQINDSTYHRSLIVCAHTLIENWRPRSCQELSPTDWEPVIALEPKVVLLGTGNTLFFPSSEILAPLIEKNIGFEIMDTAAACRTFTVLIAEDRQVVAALLLG